MLRRETTFQPSCLPLKVQECVHGDNPIGLHAHEFIEMVFFAKGRSLHEYAGQRYNLSPGDLFIIHPGEPHAYLHGRGVHIYNCLFLPEVLQPDLQFLQKIDGFFDLVMVEPFFRSERGMRGTLHLDTVERVRVEELLREISRELAHQAPGFEAVARAMFVQLLVTVARFHTQAASVTGASGNEDLSGKRTLIRDCIRYIQESYPEQISLENLADRAYLSPEYFSKIFKRLTSQTPITFINAVRIDKAKQLLAGTSLPVTEVAFQTGFSDLNYFSRQFKKRVRLTPGEYRKKSEVKK